MKKLSIILSLAAFAIFVIPGASNAQTAPATVTVAPATDDFFVGKWKSLIKGIPQGDTEVTIDFEKVDGKLTGTMFNPKENTTIKFDAITVKDGVLTTNFTTQGYDISLSLDKKDDDNFAGLMMAQFDVTGARIK